METFYRILDQAGRYIIDDIGRTSYYVQEALKFDSREVADITAFHFSGNGIKYTVEECNIPE